MNPRLRYTELECKKASFGLSREEEIKLERYRKLVSSPEQNLSATAWKFWQRVRLCRGLEIAEQNRIAKQTMLAEAYP